MERNAKGMPREPEGGVNMSRQRIDGSAENGEMCPESDAATLFDKPLAYAYVPIQRWRMLYEPERALMRGTLFEELDKPMEVYGNE